MRLRLTMTEIYLENEYLDLVNRWKEPKKIGLELVNVNKELLQTNHKALNSTVQPKPFFIPAEKTNSEELT